MVDQAQADDAVNQSKVQAAQSNLQLVKAEGGGGPAECPRPGDAGAGGAADRAGEHRAERAEAAGYPAGSRGGARAQAQVDYAKAQVQKTFIRSPISGTVLQLAAQQGETLAAGLSAPTLIIVADLNRLQVDAFVDETDIGKVRLGQEADVTVDAFPQHVFKGT